ncbi:MAG: hypothetical protein N2578_03350 [Bdellovibrionaceae bacterium]|nr:hypothetical protein [Pseudobdellovibrionaceae bacterium]
MKFLGSRLLFAMFFLTLMGCGDGLLLDENKTQPNTRTKPEPDYCSEVRTYSPAITVTGTAGFHYRDLDASQERLFGNPKIDGRIPYAEIVVRNSNGEIVQCGQTLSNGTFSVTIPKQNGTYTLSVLSRADNDKLKARVLDTLADNQPYSISKNFSVLASDSSKNIGLLEARARLSESPALEGGAFNILFLLARANDALRTATGNSSFVVPHVYVYWKAGFNPYSYYGFPNSPLSFYSPSERRIFVLGGINGAVHNVDTDHFDKSVILHEYAHHLENIYAVSNSPGGSHNGNSIIDPRLAWSEGWATFFQAAVLNTTHYVDTSGFYGDSLENGTGTNIVKFNLTELGGSASKDPVDEDGEGTYREVSISRALRKAMTTANVPLGNIWNAFNQLGLENTSYRNVGLFNQKLDSILSGGTRTSWRNVLSDERQAYTTEFYADPLIGSGSMCSRSIGPLPSALVNANLMHNMNRFYVYDHNGSSNVSIRINYSCTGTSSVKADLDLILYRGFYTYSEEPSSNPTVIRSARSISSLCNDNETLSFSGLPAGQYLIHVKMVKKTITGTMGADFHFQKLVNSTHSEYLCPTN